MNNTWELSLQNIGANPTLLAILIAVAIFVVAIGIVFFARGKRKAPKPELPKVEVPTKREVPSVEAPKVELPRAEVPKPAPLPVITEAQRVNKGLSRTKAFLQQAFDKALSGSQGAQFFDDMEEVLLTADVGIEFAEKVVGDLRKSFGVKLPVRSELKSTLSDILVRQIPQISADTSVDAHPRVIMIVGVNGAGKTTTIAKLCQRFQSQGKKVLVGGADTFRAAAMDQLKAWIERVGAEGVFQKEGSDPSAVAFDTVQAAVSRKVDVCMVDTAGRLHTKVNLMEELKKMKRVMTKAMPGAPHDVWLVVDGSTGQNALNQAREFHQHIGLTGVVVTKLDGSAKGGAVLAITAELKVPIVFIGVGETPEDLIPFNGNQFVDTILESLA